MASITPLKSFFKKVNFVNSLNTFVDTIIDILRVQRLNFLHQILKLNWIRNVDLLGTSCNTKYKRDRWVYKVNFLARILIEISGKKFQKDCLYPHYRWSLSKFALGHYNVCCKIKLTSDPFFMSWMSP